MREQPDQRPRRRAEGVRQWNGFEPGRRGVDEEGGAGRQFPQDFHREEGKREGVPGVQYSARVACKSGSKKIVSEYTMNL